MGIKITNNIINEVSRTFLLKVTEALFQSKREGSYSYPWHETNNNYTYMCIEYEISSNAEDIRVSFTHVVCTTTPPLELQEKD